ncbi:hypothetical protein U9M73_08410 [Paenibacillus phoenicis]|uniref:Uncharacterized protein n=1 Tax=Paenibacillus phoenicis TaxID=554117 RepID=A0ABU5PJA5_9BACL|nr:hypothetical protein [Paenibacillus phoenicis]MEA3570024.1 hypothetical protein [Paenibacillus phoenicis]
MLLKDSSAKEETRARYEYIWNHQLLTIDEEKVGKVLDKLEYELLPFRQKLLKRWDKVLDLFKSKFIWIIPLIVIITLILFYVLFVFVALLVD